MIKYVFLSIGAIILLFAISLGLDYGLNIGWYGFVAPKKENIRREVFENTNSYIRSKNQALLKYYQEWKKADEIDKQSLSEVIRMEFANFPEDKVQSLKLRSFLEEIKY
jgi:hypothetical protein